MSTDRLTVEGHVQVSVEDTGNEWTRPILFGQLAEIIRYLRQQPPVVSGDIVDNPLLLLWIFELTELCGFTLFHPRDRSSG